MKTFFAPLHRLECFESAKFNIDTNRTPVMIAGCADCQKAHFIAGLSEGISRRLILTHDERAAASLCDDLKLYDRDAVVWPAKDFMFFDADVSGISIRKKRISIIKKIAEGERVTVVTTPDALMEKLSPLSEITGSVLRVKPGDEIDIADFSKRLADMGYERGAEAFVPGEFAVRGSIIDVYTLTDELPFRIDLWDTEVDIIKSYDPDSQRSIENLESAVIYPASEYILNSGDVAAAARRIKRDLKKREEELRAEFKNEEASRLVGNVEGFIERLEQTPSCAGIESYLAYLKKDTACLLDYFCDDAVVFEDEPERTMAAARETEAEFKENLKSRIAGGYMLKKQSEVITPADDVFKKLKQRRLVRFSIFGGGEKNVPRFDVEAGSISPCNNRFSLLLEDLEKFKKNRYGVLILSSSPARAKRLVKNLNDNDIAAFFGESFDRELLAGEVMVAAGRLTKGFYYPAARFAVISESDIFTERKSQRRRRREFSGRRIEGFNDLSFGDYVVHENHGLGIYRGMTKAVVEGVEKDYIKLEYAGNSFLYVPATAFNIIQKYSGSGQGAPKLSRLGAKEWDKTKSRVRKAVNDMAGDLVKLYAQRGAKQGFAYSPDTVWQKEFEDMFEFEETGDQLLAIEDVKRDMESGRVMDRLICGDVGYGKTEIAIRAAFKAVQDGKQVAVLVPTTVLARQHFGTFTQRFKNFPVRVEMLSRFKSDAEQREILKDLKKGFIDIVIGTHRLLSDDVGFKDLGLLVIDEEQRFGVASKEKIKKMRLDVDVLTLTATPIPRTLHMSLSGIRDLSVLEEPPLDRVPVQTYVLEFNEETVKEAITREIRRGGQVYYVFNRVKGIEEAAARIERLVPGVSVAYAHGRMNEGRLENVMCDFVNGDIDVLVSTTIIETGIDISNVNTMIIHDADRFGLSQLYQLRGRIGRSGRTAYAFLMYRRDKIIKEEAEKRLAAIRDFSDLGSGFKIAMKDLEIRGAGNLLGAEQHGHMEAVGYDLYCKMLNEAVSRLKGEETVPDFECTVDINTDAHIPDSYIRNEAVKLDVYRRIAGIESMEEHEDMEDELFDRFGSVPDEVKNLLDIALLKSMARNAQVTEISQKNGKIKITMLENASVDVSKIPELITEYDGWLKFLAPEHAFVYTPRNVGSEFGSLIEELKTLTQKIGAMKAEQK